VDKIPVLEPITSVQSSDLNVLDIEMEKILKDKTHDLDTKIKLFNQVLGQYIKNNKPKPDSISELTNELRQQSSSLNESIKKEIQEVIHNELNKLNITQNISKVYRPRRRTVVKKPKKIKPTNLDQTEYYDSNMTHNETLIEDSESEDENKYISPYNLQIIQNPLSKKKIEGLKPSRKSSRDKKPVKPFQAGQGVQKLWLSKRFF
jgi:hypothetical protein